MPNSSHARRRDKSIAERVRSEVTALRREIAAGRIAPDMLDKLDRYERALRRVRDRLQRYAAFDQHCGRGRTRRHPRARRRRVCSCANVRDVEWGRQAWDCAVIAREALREVATRHLALRQRTADLLERSRELLRNRVTP